MLYGEYRHVGQRRQQVRRTASTSLRCPGVPKLRPHLLASYSLKVAARPSACVFYEVSWDVHAEATNSAGLTAKTKKFHLRYRAPSVERFLADGLTRSDGRLGQALNVVRGTILV
jgi:hypothetical protein